MKPHADDVPGGAEPPLGLALWLVSLLASLCWAGIVLGGLLPGSGAAALVPADAAVPHSLAWHVAQLTLMFLAWAGLCTALMLPLAGRAALLFARLAGEGSARSTPPYHNPRTTRFVLGYIGTWTGFALLAAIVHWSLHESGPAGLYPSTLRHPALIGLALVAAGLYQWTPVKHACLEHCRAPYTGILSGWRDAPDQPAWRGAAHAWQCLGSCWLLMLVLLAAGPDNPAAVTAVGLLVLAEIRLAAGHWVACAGGLALLALGTLLLFP